MVSEVEANGITIKNASLCRSLLAVVIDHAKVELLCISSGPLPIEGSPRAINVPRGTLLFLPSCPAFFSSSPFLLSPLSFLSLFPVFAVSLSLMLAAFVTKQSAYKCAYAAEDHPFFFSRTRRIDKGLLAPCGLFPFSAILPFIARLYCRRRIREQPVFFLGRNVRYARPNGIFNVPDLRVSDRHD